MNYIKRKEFLKKCAETFGCSGVMITAIVGIADQCSTAEAVKVVRCKDCLHSSYYGKICHYSVGRDVSPDHYCSYGERRANDE